MATVELLLSHGARVASVDISDPPQDAIPSSHRIFMRASVGYDYEVKNVVETVLETWGRIDILVNNAGIMDNFAATADIVDQTWRKVFSVNVDGPMYFMRTCIPIFLQQESRGCIVNLCSTASISGAAGGSAYTASKHALLGLTRSTAWMYAKEGIRCNALIPGGVAGTNIVKGLGEFNQFGFDRAQQYISCTPEFLTVKDIMPSILYLITAPGVNGAELAVNHGLTAA